MKRLLLLLALLCCTQVHAQPIICGEDIEQFLLGACRNDTLIITAKRLWGDQMADTLVAKALFKTEYPEKTVDRIFFDAHSNWYQVYVPEKAVVFTVTQRPGYRASTYEHLVWLITYIRRYRHECEY